MIRKVIDDTQSLEACRHCAVDAAHVEVLAGMGCIDRDGFYRANRRYIHKGYSPKVEDKRGVMLWTDSLANVMPKIGSGTEAQWAPKIKIGEAITTLCQQSGLAISQALFGIIICSRSGCKLRVGYLLDEDHGGNDNPCDHRRNQVYKNGQA